MTKKTLNYWTRKIIQRALDELNANKVNKGISFKQLRKMNMMYDQLKEDLMETRVKQGTTPYNARIEELLGCIE